MIADRLFRLPTDFPIRLVADFARQSPGMQAPSFLGKWGTRVTKRASSVGRTDAGRPHVRKTQEV